MGQAEPIEQKRPAAARLRPALVVIEVEQPSKRETFCLLAQTPGVRVLCVEEPPMK